MKNPSSPTAPSIEDWRKYNILIVDDEPHIIEQIERELLFENFSILRATSSQEGLKIIKENLVHVILSDQKMPQMSGTEFIRKAREEHPHIVGIILSAFSETSYILDALNKTQVLYYLLKPWNKQELISCLTKALKLSYDNLMAAKDRTLVQSVRELYQTQNSLEDTIHTLGAISELTHKLSEGLRKQLEESKKVSGQIKF